MPKPPIDLFPPFLSSYRILISVFLLPKFLQSQHKVLKKELALGLGTVDQIKNVVEVSYYFFK